MMEIFPSFTPTQSLFSSSLKAFRLPFGYCCHLMSQNKIAMGLPFPKARKFMEITVGEQQLFFLYTLK